MAKMMEHEHQRVQAYPTIRRQSSEQSPNYQAKLAANEQTHGIEPGTVVLL